MAVADALAGPRHVHRAELDGDSEVDPNPAQRVRQVRKRVVRVAAGVRHDDHAAPADHHRPQTQVLEMPAVRQIDVRVRVRLESEQLANERPDAERGIAPLPRGGIARVAEPQTETRIGERQQEGAGLRRVHPHSGTRRRTRHGERRSERQPGCGSASIRSVLR